MVPSSGFGLGSDNGNRSGNGSQKDGGEENKVRALITPVHSPERLYPVTEGVCFSQVAWSTGLCFRAPISAPLISLA